MTERLQGFCFRGKYVLNPECHLELVAEDILLAFQTGDEEEAGLESRDEHIQPHTVSEYISGVT